MRISPPSLLRVSLALAATVLAGSPAPVHACAVCFGQAGDPLVEGAKAGVIFLAICIYTLLMMCVGIVAMWMHRARKLARAEAEAAGTLPNAFAAPGATETTTTA